MQNIHFISIRIIPSNKAMNENEQNELLKAKRDF